MNYEKSSKELLKYVGGNENVGNYTNCITRMRINAKDQSLVNVDLLKKIEGVIHVQVVGKTTQVVFGPEVGKIRAEFDTLMGHKESDSEPEGSKEEKLGVTMIIQKIVFPAVPLLFGIGIIRIIAMLTLGGGNIAEAGTLLKIFDLIGNKGLALLPVFFAYNTTKFMKVSPFYSLLFVIIINMPEITTIPLYGHTLQQGAGGMISAVAIAYAAGSIEKLVGSKFPKFLKQFNPVFIIILLGAVSFGLILPLANAALGYLIVVFASLASASTTTYIIACIILGGGYSILVMFGLHMALFAAIIPILMETGVAPLIAAGFLGAAGQVGAALAVWVKYRKTSEELNDHIGTILPAILGIVEPLMYSINLPRIKPFIIAIISSTIMGGLIGIFRLEMVAPMPGILGAIGFDTPTKMALYGSIWVGTGILAFILTGLTYKEKEKA